jgi:CRP-like cAMP-binding protein
MAHERVGVDELPLTQQFLAAMLGARRASVTEALGALERAGAIGDRRGHVRVTDRERLEASACPCYGLIRRQFDALLT